jgi:hypothetical protein
LRSYKVSDVTPPADIKKAGGGKGGPPVTSLIHTLSEVQLEEFREAFEAFDKDGGGSIDKHELHELFKSLGQTPTEAEIDEMVKCADADGNGDIDFYEVCAPPRCTGVPIHSSGYPSGGVHHSSPPVAMRPMRPLCASLPH